MRIFVQTTFFKPVTLSLQVKYKDEFNKSKGKLLGTDVTPEMALSKDIAPVISVKSYKEKAKADQFKINVAAGNT